MQSNWDGKHAQQILHTLYKAVIAGFIAKNMQKGHKTPYDQEGLDASQYR